MKKARPKPNQFVIRAFPPELEKETRELHELVLCGAEPLLRSFENPAEMMSRKDSQRAFFCAAHQGFHKAQNHIIDAVLNDADNSLPRQRSQSRITFKFPIKRYHTLSEGTDGQKSITRRPVGAYCPITPRESL